VNEILVQIPPAVAVFNEYGSDACGGGDATLEEAARRDGVDANALIEMLDALVTRGGAPMKPTDVRRVNGGPQ
jgi:iron-sulfur cluster repair protein YtfE (RIC family)